MTEPTPPPSSVVEVARSLIDGLVDFQLDHRWDEIPTWEI